MVRIDHLYLSKQKFKVMKKSNYDLVLEIIESYEDEEILNDFKNEFEVGKNVSKSKYFIKVLLPP